MKKLTGCLVMMALIPAALMVGCSGNSSTPASPINPSGPLGTFTKTPTPTATTTIGSPTATRTATASPTITATSTVTLTRTTTSTPTVTKTPTSTATSTATPTITSTPTVTGTPTPLTVQTAISLGTASTYAVMAYTGINANGALNPVCGNIGVFPGNLGTITGLLGQSAGCTGVTFTGPAAGPASIAQSDLANAYATAAGRTPNHVYPAGDVDLANMTLASGLYQASSSLQISAGTLTLSGAAGSVFIFQIGSTLTTASSTHVVLTGGVTADNVYWQVGSSATLGSSSTFSGIIMANDDITVGADSTVSGQTLALGIGGASGVGLMVFDGNDTVTVP